MCQERVQRVCQGRGKERVCVASVSRATQEMRDNLCQERFKKKTRRVSQKRESVCVHERRGRMCVCVKEEARDTHSPHSTLLGESI